MENKYWHETNLDEIKCKTWKEVNENYKQPDWCGYPEALSPLGCASLISSEIKIDEDYCKNCPEYVVKHLHN